MVFSQEGVTRENRCRIASPVTKTLLMVSHIFSRQSRVHNQLMKVLKDT